MESLIIRGIKVLVVSPLQAQALTPIVKQVMDTKIPVVTLDREVNTKVTCRIGAENKPIGENAGKLIAEKIAKGEQVPERVILKSTRVDASNVDKYLGKGF